MRGFYALGYYGEGTLQGELLSRVFSPDECCSWLPHMCHCAKFEISAWPSYSNLTY